MTPQQRQLANSAMYLNKAVEQINEQKSRIAELEAENAELKAATNTKSTPKSTPDAES